MSSLNSHPTFHYSQPEEYRFSHDSVFLAREVFEIEKERCHGDFCGDFGDGFEGRPDNGFSGLRALDLCSGCGIIGLDWLFHICRANMSLPLALDFLEIQDVYRPHFAANLRSLLAKFPQASATSISSYWQSYDNFCSEESPEGKYDIILSNPPYFRPGQGALSDSDFKNRCRFFIDADFASLLRSLQRNLRPGGRAYVLIPDLSPHGISVESEVRNLCHLNNWKVQIDSSRKIRKTNLFIFTS
jgi:tRNA1(Val) A37 N6-methylase TrmN6